MQHKYLRRIAKMLKSTKGSFTLEASLVFPLIFITLLVLIFVSWIVFNKGMVYYKASMASEACSFTWNNSYRITNTGELENIVNNDGLYWRITQHEGDKISRKKTGNALKVFVVEDNVSGTSTFERSIVSRVVFNVEKQLHIPEIQASPYEVDDSAEASVKSYVADPVELTRNTDFVMDYVVGKFIN